MKTPVAITDWDARWPVERVFQAVAVQLATEAAGQHLHVIDTSSLSVPSGGFYSWHPGSADIVACRHGRFTAIELKASSNKPTGPQTREGERIENAAGVYVVARTMREVFEALELEVPDA